MSEIISINEIIKANQKYEEKMKEEIITGTILFCNPKVKHILLNTLYENNMDDIPIIDTPMAEENKVYMVTDKEFIENFRQMSGEKVG